MESYLMTFLEETKSLYVQEWSSSVLNVRKQLQKIVKDVNVGHFYFIFALYMKFSIMQYY